MLLVDVGCWLVLVVLGSGWSRVLVVVCGCSMLLWSLLFLLLSLLVVVVVEINGVVHLLMVGDLFIVVCCNVSFFLGLW